MDEKIETLLKNGIYKLTKHQISDTKLKAAVQFFKFVCVGILNNALNFAVYFVGITYGMHYIIANILGVTCSIINSFYWNSKIVFNVKNLSVIQCLGRFLKTVYIYIGTSLIINSVILYLLIDQLGCNKVISLLICLVITVPVNFVLNKCWVYRTHK